LENCAFIFVGAAFDFFGVGLFALGEGLFAEFVEAGDHRVDVAEAGIGMAGGGDETFVDQALDDGLEGGFGFLRFGNEGGQTLLVLVAEGVGFGMAQAFAKPEDRSVGGLNVEAARPGFADQLRNAPGGIVVEEKYDGVLFLSGKVVEWTATG
jgi:hypothetical protein